MFETHVTRLPSTSSATTSDLLRNAQNIAGAAEKLNLMTRVAMTKALDAQINAEVDGGTGDEAADIWRTVGADYRDQMRSRT
ncbi:protein [Lentinula edodes]|uniref:Protein n=1 Tax=Lentinula edodes TaxID=5353 RepID=A0A1Q3E1D8_LENED|nr:protein [Lentinula edodes]